MMPKSLRISSSGRAPVGEPGSDQYEGEQSEKADKAITREIRGSYIRDSC